VSFGAKLEEIASIASRAELEAWRGKAGGGDLRAFLDIAEILICGISGEARIVS